MENHHFSWENPLFLWPCSIVFCMFTRGYLRYISVKQNKNLQHWRPAPSLASQSPGSPYLLAFLCTLRLSISLGIPWGCFFFRASFDHRNVFLRGLTWRSWSSYSNPDFWVSFNTMESYWEDQPPVKIWEYPPNQSSMVAIEQLNLKKTLEIYIPLKIGPKKNPWGHRLKWWSSAAYTNTHDIPSYRETKAMP